MDNERGNVTHHDAGESVYIRIVSANGIPHFLNVPYDIIDDVRRALTTASVEHSERLYAEQLEQDIAAREAELDALG